MYCFPSTWYVIGTPSDLAPSGISVRISPVFLSRARRLISSLVQTGLKVGIMPSEVNMKSSDLVSSGRPPGKPPSGGRSRSFRAL